MPGRRSCLLGDLSTGAVKLEGRRDTNRSYGWQIGGITPLCLQRKDKDCRHDINMFIVIELVTITVTFQG